MIENYQKPKNRRFRYSPCLAVVLIIIISTQLICCSGSKETESPTPSPTIPSEPLKLDELQNHEYEDLGISISYPSDWEELPRNSSDTILINSQSHVCMGYPIALGVFSSAEIGSYDLQSASDFFTSSFTEKTGNTMISNDLIKANGMSIIKLILLDTSSYDFEIWKVVYFLSDDYMLGIIAADSLPDCWEYYEEAVYTIVSSYRFLD